MKELYVIHDGSISVMTRLQKKVFDERENKYVMKSDPNEEATLNTYSSKTLLGDDQLQVLTSYSQKLVVTSPKVEVFVFYQKTL
jgi:hypothetical protein